MGHTMTLREWQRDIARREAAKSTSALATTATAPAPVTVAVAASTANDSR